MKKKTLIFLSVAAALALALCACGAKPTGITLGDGPLKVAVGGTAVLEPEFTWEGEAPAEGPAVTFASADEAVATVVQPQPGVELTAETTVKELLALHGLYVDGAFVEGSKRVSFAGYNGGRSYGEQLDAITDYILANQMTLEDVYEMFRTVNQASTQIEDRDAIAGATITFDGDFQRMVYLAIHGELFEGVVTRTENEDGSQVMEVVTQGYGGEIETNITFDANGRITAIAVRDAQETDGVGGVLTAAGSDYINALIAGQDDLDAVDAVSGATMTSTALKKAVEYAKAALAE